MALTTCKECKKEVSTEAQTCPYCGIDHPGVTDSNHRIVGAVVLAALLFLFINILTRPEKNNDQYADNVRIIEQKEAVVAELDQDAPLTQPALAKSKPLLPAAKEASKPSQQPALQTPPPPINPKQPEPKKPERDHSKNSAQADLAQRMVMRMLDHASQEGGLSREAEIQHSKQQIEHLPKPAKGDKKAAKALNAKGLALSRKGDFNQAVKLFEEAHTQDASDVEIVNNLGFSYLKQGNLDLARHAIMTALTLSPGRATAWENLGEVFSAKGDESKAVACFSNAYRFSKDRLNMHQHMKKLNATERVKYLKQARAKAMHWAETAYLKSSK